MSFTYAILAFIFFFINLKILIYNIFDYVVISQKYVISHDGKNYKPDYIRHNYKKGTVILYMKNGDRTTLNLDDSPIKIIRLYK